MKFNIRYSSSELFRIFLILWGIINLLQARFTQLNSDEAYYWMYSRNLDWGYFDHPPMIALMIKAGYFIIRNELGVRLIVVLSSMISFYIVWCLIDCDLKKNKGNVLLFILLICSLPIFNIYGFIATPDSPLLLFTALFLFVYREFDQNNNWKHAFFLGIVMAAIMYSKYHGSLLILMVILSNLKLLRNFKFYIAALLALLFFLPHIYWQYSNDFPSLKYHLVDRVSDFNFKNVPEYLLNTLLIHNPLILPAGIFLITRLKNPDRFQRTLSFIVIGTFVFFFISSFRYHIEPQWTALISIPFIIIIFNNSDYYSKISNYLKYVTIISIPVILFIRGVFMIDFLPIKFLKQQYHGTKQWVKEIEKIAGNKPVVFTNSYQNASKYSFYSKQFAHTLNNLSYRKNQYDLWDFEEQIHGKEVLYVPHFLTDYNKGKLTKYITSKGDTIFAKEYMDFQSLQKECIILTNNDYRFSKKDRCQIQLQIYNPYPFPVNLKHTEFPVNFQVCFFKKGILEYNKGLEFSKIIEILNIGDTIKVNVSFEIEDIPAGKYKLSICSESGIQYIVYNSKFKDVTISE